ncbi:MAG: bifunctional (p)ppGpp synthetase/guanosine-3',5'-bis(diphosphate) 3'-pyrophosphohydrolase [Herpetosiphon sp.]
MDPLPHSSGRAALAVVSSTTTHVSTEQDEAVAIADRLAEIQPLIQRMRAYLPETALDPVKQAYLVASAAHGDQRRNSGEAYILHPLAVAHILVDLQLDPASVMAGLLHDVAEDTRVGIELLQKQFGDDVARLVDGVTKITSMEGRSKEEAQVGTYRKMFVAMADDPRVVLIKLADRLHNIRTLDGLPVDKQRRIAKETLEIYAPLAHRMGIWQIKWELEDKAFRYFNPDAYSEISRQLSLRRDVRERIVQRVMGRLRSEISKEGIDAEITGRPKHIYSIFKKMERKGVLLDQIFDQLAVRVIVKEVGDCYRILGIVHAMWKPVLSEFDDYIAVPKESMYQSLHTTVLIPGGQPCEVQIRTGDMHKVAEHGIAAHWRYKEGTSRSDSAVENKLQWLRTLLSWKQEIGDEREFVDTIKGEMLEDQVYVFSPKGRIIDLVQGSTPVDFAYRIHSEVGNRCIGSRVNTKQVPLDHVLQNGDIVQIVTSKIERGPSRDWMEFVKTSNARNHIKRWFRRQNRDANIDTGRSLLDHDLKKLSLAVSFDTVADINGFKIIDDMFFAVGIGESNPRDLLRKVMTRQHEQASDNDPLARIPVIAPRPYDPAPLGIHVRGASDVYKRLARCCNPVEGESIIGYVTQGKGLTIHRADCHNVINERQRARLMPVEWGANKELKRYPVPLRIEAWDRVGLWHDVTQVMKDGGVNIEAVQMAQNRHPDRTTLLTTVMVDSLDQLSSLIDKLGRVKDVIEARRDRQAQRPPTS